MLTRHSPLHALDRAEAGWFCWWVKAAVSSVLPAARRPPAVFCSTRASSDHIATQESITSLPGRLVSHSRKKVRGLILLPRLEDRRGRHGHPRPRNTQPAPSLSGFVCCPQHLDSIARMPCSPQRPSGITEVGVARARRPQTQLPRESQTMMIRNPDSFSKKNLLDNRDFFRNPRQRARVRR
jgi:hypothetical protein